MKGEGEAARTTGMGEGEAKRALCEGERTSTYMAATWVSVCGKATCSWMLVVALFFKSFGIRFFAAFYSERNGRQCSAYALMACG